MRLYKVVAYVTRLGRGGTGELLVFEHRDYPEAGTQVPAGTMEEGEKPENAAARELEEESGLSGCRLMADLGIHEWLNSETGNLHERHVYHFAAPEGTPEKWPWIETSGGAVPEEEGYVFLYRWVPLSEVPLLAGDQGAYLHLLQEPWS